MENGPIQKGDYLTPSNTPGVAMRATKAGMVIGQAMTEYIDENNPAYVVAFIKSGPSNGSKLREIIPGLTIVSTPEGQINNDVEIVNEGDSTVENQDEDLETITEVETIQKMALKYFLANKINLEEAIEISEIYTDRLSAALEIITPTVITDTLSTNSIITSTLDVVTFNSDTYFAVPPLFNSDTAGFAIIKEGEKEVDISYEESYMTEQTNTNLSLFTMLIKCID
jgi:hypothetical protein